MNANAKKAKRNGDSSARVRGVVLSPHGWQRFQAAKQQVESEKNWGKRFTQEDLNERTGLSLNTLARILKRELEQRPIMSLRSLRGKRYLSNGLIRTRTGIMRLMRPCFMVVKPSWHNCGSGSWQNAVGWLGCSELGELAKARSPSKLLCKCSLSSRWWYGDRWLTHPHSRISWPAC
jgi:hypothetical protein